jgi:CheY-like chemotaxis protein
VTLFDIDRETAEGLDWDTVTLGDLLTLADGHDHLRVTANAEVAISPDNLPRIFDPFFSTKPAGVGTGLGLSICRSIVSALGGDITAQSHDGQGTTFSVLLKPFTGSQVPRPPSERHHMTLPPQRRGRVLIVDDEPPVASMLGCMIEEEHDIELARSGPEALERLAKGATDFDAILCDLMMPGMTGMDLYRRIRAEHPGTEERIVFMTGGAFLPQVVKFLETVENPKLDKPFDLEKLRKVLKHLSKRPDGA